MEIFRVLAGYSLGRADVVRRAMSKKKFDVLEGERANFVYGNEKENIPGCAANGVPADIANHIFDEMLDFANYAFNKAHAVCYAVLAYQTAYLKYHYPQEYMAALLTSVLGQTGKVSEYIAQCKDLGITVLPPDVNESRADFTVAGDNIRFGIGAVKNVGVGLIEHLVKEREENGKFQSFEDFCQRMSDHDLNKRMLENLIKCGAFDSLGHRRSQLMAVYVGILDAASSDKKKNLEGQIDLFADFRDEMPVRTTMPNIPEYPVRELLSMERETCGLYLSGHPMEDLAPLAQKAKATPIGKIHLGQEDGNAEVQDGDYVTIAGMVSSVKMKLTKKQTNMAYITIEDLSGSLEIMAFEKVLVTGGCYFQVDQPVLVYGRVSAREDEAPKIICDMVAPLNEQWAVSFQEQINRRGYAGRKQQENFQFREQEQRPILRRLCIKLTSRSLPETQQVARMIMEFPGKDALYMRFEDTGEQILRASAVSVNNELVDRLEKMLGCDRVVVQNLKS
jgi:DNA polymerase-3 subunit alpha